ncbi:HpcH/HpaI aldolase family protein [Brevibacillus centrosporus]|uniref:HpcH/HpaI aldolase family protein n=1 Tax=Brevibacillus centrosporus TaxID=54910 RepID=UPI002E1DBE2F|nr:aldolase/citrate lyase family protein [Brevibacillus centrosporus]MED1950679.1 aldolase/citrate lyase family protein [Brevibacillus centrosporus]
MGNLVKEKIKNGEKTVGAFIGIYSPAIVEMAGHAGFDFIVIDDEHGAFSYSELENMIRTAESVNLVPIVRVSYDPSSIQKALDRGAKGVQVPMVNTREAAQAAVALAKYPPYGTRGAAYSHRAARYGKDSGRAFLDRENEDTLVIVHIETPQAAEHFQEIMSVPGVDIGFIGTTDLSVNMGKSSPNDPEVQALVDKLFAQGEELGAAVGIVAGNLEGVREGMQRGSAYIGVVGTSIITAAFASVVKEAENSK